jgi:hypothetical protein
MTQCPGVVHETEFLEQGADLRVDTLVHPRGVKGLAGGDLERRTCRKASDGA